MFQSCAHPAFAKPPRPVIAPRCISFPALHRVTVTGLALASMLASVAAAPSQAEAMFRGDASHSGIYHTKPPERLALKWKYQTGGPIVSSPAVVHGTVFVGSADNTLYALGADTGNLRWKFQIPAPKDLPPSGDVNSSPAVSNGVVFVYCLDGKLYALDEKNGAPLWTFSTGGEHRFTKPGIDYLSPSTEMMPDPWDLFLSSPTIVDGTVFFGSGDGFVYAVEAATGHLVWKHQTGDVVHSTPAVANGRVYIGSFDGFFYALNARSGELAWKFKTRDDPAGRYLMAGIPGSAAVVDGVVYFGCRDGHVYALNEKTGQAVTPGWEKPYDAAGSWVVCSPALHGNQLLIVTSDTRKFIALDRATGAEIFSLPDSIYAFSSPAVAGDRAFFGTFDGKIHAVDLVKQCYVGEFAVPGYAQNKDRYLDSQGQVRPEMVWTGDTLDSVIFGLRSKIFSLGSILSSPCIDNGVVYFGSVDGAIYAVGD